MKILKYVIIIILCIAVLVFTAFISIKKYTYSTIETNYNSKVEIWEQTNEYINDGSIVFLGDSITEQFPLNEYFVGYDILNRGIFGDTTDGAIKRLESTVLSTNPSKVFILIGVNDLYKTSNSNEDIAYNIMSMAQDIKLHNFETDIYIVSILPIQKQDTTIVEHLIFSQVKNEDIDEINDMLSDVDKGVATYIDINSELKTKEGDLDSKYTYDSIHLSSAGYKVISEELAPYLEN